MALFSSKQDSYLGVDIGAHGIKIVELKKNRGRPQLWTYGILRRNLDIHVKASRDKSVAELIAEERGENLADIEAAVGKKKKEKGFTDPELMEDERINEYAELLKVLIERSKVQGRRATSSLPVSQVFHAVINFPKASEKEIDSLVSAEIAKMIRTPIDEMQLVYQKIPGQGDGKESYTTVLVTAAPKRLVAFYTAIFQKAGLQLQELETEAFALSRSLIGHDKSVSMVVDMGAERTNFFIIDGGVPLTHRSLKIGGNDFDTVIQSRLGVMDVLVDQIKRDISTVGHGTIPTDIFVRQLDPIAKEIQYSFDLFLKQTGNENKRPEKIILTGGSSMFPPIQEYLQKSFSMRVFLGDPWARVLYQDGLKDVIDEIGPRMAVTIGLALRNFS